MHSINRIKFIQSLSTKKNRLKHGVFVVEGEKNVLEFISSQWEIESIYGTEEWTGDCQRISQKELDRIAKILAIVNSFEDVIKNIPSEEFPK